MVMTYFRQDSESVTGYDIFQTRYLISYGMEYFRQDSQSVTGYGHGVPGETCVPERFYTLDDEGRSTTQGRTSGPT